MSPTLASPASTPIAPADMVGFGKLVVRAREKQHGSLTYKQYAKLLSRFIGLQPKPQAGLLMGCYLFHQCRFRAALQLHGITVRPEFAPIRKLPGSATGFARVGEVERLVLKRARRRSKLAKASAAARPAS